MTNDKLEKNLIKALELLDHGMSPREILNLFPEQQNEVKEIIAAAQILQQSKDEIKPSKELLAQIIRQVEAEPVQEKIHSHGFRWASFQFLAPVTGVIAVILLFLLVSLTAQFPAKITQQLAPSSPIAFEGGDVFDLTAIQEESKQVDFDQDLYLFLAQEESLEELDAALADL